MSDEKVRLSDEQLEELLGRALADDMIPTTPEAVRRAEQSGEEAMAPRAPAEGFPSPVEGAVGDPERPMADVSTGASQRPGRVVELRPAPGTRLYPALRAGVVGAALGVAATLALAPRGENTQWIGPETGPGATVPNSGEPPKAALDLSMSCPGECCAGSGCAVAAKACASERTCVPCQPQPKGRYRLQVGDMTWARDQLSTDEPAPRLCVRVGRDAEQCLDAVTVESPEPPSAGAPSAWQVTSGSYSAAQLLSGTQLRLRRQANSQLVAEWSRQVAITTDTLCKGLKVELSDAEGKAVAAVSVFLLDAHFVELERASSVGPLLRSLTHLGGAKNASLKIYETRAEGAGRFVLTLGPLDFDSSETLRWRLLDAGLSPQLTLGSDYLGEPRVGD